jgi:hypothetical protein
MMRVRRDVELGVVLGTGGGEATACCQPKAERRLVNSATSLSPVRPTAVMIAKAIPAQMSHIRSRLRRTRRAEIFAASITPE